VRIRFFGLLAVALLIAACGGGSGASTRPSLRASIPAAATPGASTTSGGEVTIEVATNPLGDILVDGDGMTLYAFTPDEGQSAPTCNDTCAENWPPLTGDATAGDGVDDSKLSTITRDDGSTQVVYGEYPLYHFSGDLQAGKTNGQGLNGNWFVVGADGELVGETPGAS
jgi:predicted lipoprotein with Yx(FWY)xxD motif